MSLFAVSENYPDLKASENFLELQNSLNEIEDEIQMSKRYYNGTVRNLNTLIESFPSNFVARLFAFIKAPYYEISSDQDRSVPRIEAGSTA